MKCNDAQNSIYFHREHKNDFPAKCTSYVLRITKIAIPFVALYQPFGKTIAVVSSCARLATSVHACVTAPRKDRAYTVLKASVDVPFAVAALAGSIFMHPVGMAITTCHDIGINGYNIYEAVKKRNAFDVAKETVKLANNAFYLAALATCSLELQVVSLGISVITGSVSSIDEFKKGNWLEAGGEVLMTAFRINRFAGSIKLLKQKWKIEAAVKKVFVGELGEKWQFPSDHLPVGVEVDGVKVISWNVMNTKYMEWVKEKNSQGLNGSMITQLDVQTKSDGLTKRDERVVEMINTMINKSNHVIALQECSEPFLNKLQSELPSNWKIVRSSEKAVMDQDVVLFDTSKLGLRADRSETSTTAYTSMPGRKLQTVTFEKVGKVAGSIFRVFNSHIPGEPTIPCRQEFANYVQKTSQADEVVIALGDNNFERHEMDEAYRNAGLGRYKLFTSWQTNIDPITKESKGIDHVLVNGASTSRQLKANEILRKRDRLKETINLLSPKDSPWFKKIFLPLVQSLA